MELTSARHAFITGGASGIGLGIAHALAERGIAVTIADVDREGLDSACAAGADGIRAICLDVRDREAWAARVATFAILCRAFLPG